MGASQELKFQENATVPIPKELKTERWIQLTGCGQPQPFPKRQAHAEAESRPKEPIEALPRDRRTRTEAVILRRAPGTGYATLRVSEAWLSRNGGRVDYSLQGVCRFDPASERWTPLPRPQGRKDWSLTPLEGNSSGQERILYEFPRQTALFWAEWREVLDGERYIGSHSVHEQLVTSGGMLCNDISLGPAPPGKEPACVPYDDHAEARFVPSPKSGCELWH
jgi:hypothetical protein